MPIPDDIGAEGSLVPNSNSIHPTKSSLASPISSPYIFQPDPVSPPLPPNAMSSTYLPVPDDFSLDASTASSIQHVAIPSYPHPTRPFAVQPIPKMPTGQAPIFPLDRSGTRVRRWQTAHREIKGIAGGRWFARSWVGAKISDFADSTPSFPVQPIAPMPSRPTPHTQPPALAMAVSVPKKRKDTVKLSQQEVEGNMLTFMQPQTGPIMVDDSVNPQPVPSIINVDSDVEMVHS